MWSIYTKRNNTLFGALYCNSRANNLNEFKQAVPYIHPLSLNVIYGDAKGTITGLVSAKL